MAIVERDTTTGRFKRVTPAVVGPRIKRAVTVPAQRDAREVRRVVYTSQTPKGV